MWKIDFLVSFFFLGGVEKISTSFQSNECCSFQGCYKNPVLPELVCIASDTFAVQSFALFVEVGS